MLQNINIYAIIIQVGQPNLNLKIIHCNYEFDFLVGAGGKQSKLKGFMKKPSDRTGKATAITFNLVNEEKEADRKVCFYCKFYLLK